MQRLIFALMLAAAIPASAQGRSKKVEGVPAGHRPPAGMCRIWIDEVPPGRQPSPTDCVTAVRNRPANARVIFGDDTPFPGRGRTKEMKRNSRLEDRDDDSREAWPRAGDRDEDRGLRKLKKDKKDKKQKKLKVRKDKRDRDSGEDDERDDDR